MGTDKLEQTNTLRTVIRYIGLVWREGAIKQNVPSIEVQKIT